MEEIEAVSVNGVSQVLTPNRWVIAVDLLWAALLQCNQNPVALLLLLATCGIFKAITILILNHGIIKVIFFPCRNIAIDAYLRRVGCSGILCWCQKKCFYTLAYRIREPPLPHPTLCPSLFSSSPPSPSIPSSLFPSFLLSFLIVV